MYGLGFRDIELAKNPQPRMCFTAPTLNTQHLPRALSSFPTLRPCTFPYAVLQVLHLRLLERVEIGFLARALASHKQENKGCTINHP